MSTPNDAPLPPSPPPQARPTAPIGPPFASQELASEVEVGKLKKQKTRQEFLTPITVFVLGSTVLVLGAILVPSFIRARAGGHLTGCKSNLKNIGTALEMYCTDHDGKYPNSLDVLTPRYLKTIPSCPSTNSMTYVLTLGPKAAYNSDHYEDYYFIECTGENHTSVGVTGDFPAYNGIQGLLERQPYDTPRFTPAP